MRRPQQSRKLHSSSFTKFVARLQHTLSSKNVKSSTPIIEQYPPACQTNPAPLPTFPSFSNSNRPRIRLSQILYDPSRHVEYLSEIEEKHDSDSSQQSLSIDSSDSCYDSMGERDRINLSKMNVSMDNPREIHGRHSAPKMLKLPNSFDTARFHSTAIEDIGHF